MEDFNNAMQAETSKAVKLWMNWMMVIFLASIPFVWKRKPARWALLAFVLTGFTGYGIWLLTHNVHLLGIAHLLLWLPLAIYLWKSVLNPTARSQDNPPRLYFIWVCLLFATILISLVFDVRDIFLVLTGQK